MNVLGNRLEHNEYLSERETIYILGKYKRLNEMLSQMVCRCREINYSFHMSRQSEACYITLSFQNASEYDEYKISIRNHSNYANSQYDKAFLMSEYQDWHQLKKYVIEEINRKMEEWGVFAY